jgi:hypothetical protein
VPLSRNLGTLISWNPLGHSRPVTGLLYLCYYYCYFIFHDLFRLILVHGHTSVSCLTLPVLPCILLLFLLLLLVLLLGTRDSVVVKALRYKPACRWFDSRWCHLHVIFLYWRSTKQAYEIVNLRNQDLFYWKHGYIEGKGGCPLIPRYEL